MTMQDEKQKKNHNLSFLHLARPALDPASRPHRYIDTFTLHPNRIFDETVSTHPTGVCPLFRVELQHRREKLADLQRLLRREMVLLPEHVGQRPVT